MSDLVSASVEVSKPSHVSDGFESMTHINDGFLGTGYSSMVEGSFILMALIIFYVGYSFARYYLAGTQFHLSVLEVLGLRD